MSIASQCPDCCTCPTPTVEWDSRSATGSKMGLLEPAGFASTPRKVYLKADFTGTREFISSGGTHGEDIWTGSVTLVNPPVGGFSLTLLSTWVINNRSGGSACGDPMPTVEPPAPQGNATISGQLYFAYGDRIRTALNDIATGFPINSTQVGNNAGNSPSTCTGETIATLGDEFTTAALKIYTYTLLPAWDGDWNDTPGSFCNISPDELSCALRESRYRFRFEIPLVNTGLNYRLSWVERFIPEAGVGITSVDVYSRGVYRPAVTLSAPPAGGTQAYAVAVMSSAGTVASILILNPGSGYTSAPTVTVQSATGGGTTATATATLTGRQVSAITVGTAGNYLPTLAFTGGGGSGATATCTMDARGGIATVTVGAAGSGYTTEPTLTVTARVASPTAADLLLHLGTETARCAVWDGVTPPGYDSATPSTYPIIGDGTNPYFELPVPSADGTTLVANLRAVCDGTPCP